MSYQVTIIDPDNGTSHTKNFKTKIEKDLDFHNREYCMVDVTRIYKLSKTQAGEGYDDALAKIPRIQPKSESNSS